MPGIWHFQNNITTQRAIHNDNVFYLSQLKMVFKIGTMNAANGSEEQECCPGKMPSHGDIFGE
jgi:hypothetical protein